VRRACGDQPLGLLSRQRPIALHLARKQANLRGSVDPLPLVARHAKQRAHRGEVSIDRCRLVAVRKLALDHLPDEIAVDLVKVE